MDLWVVGVHVPWCFDDGFGHGHGGWQGNGGAKGEALGAEAYVVAC